MIIDIFLAFVGDSMMCLTFLQTTTSLRENWEINKRGYSKWIAEKAINLLIVL
ncbi:hypothetical protein I6N95_24875 [Vagococcus sp. BWB3-3]|uniref:Uncharacterized protein n=1 Tax=Vagococcus allomyrinae TaxID=2794353 RepID=A0A940SYA6_9ENTE|nr:hypothetical protein [Vagococcus allomyrinae]MBP1044246.1 hypothetical protein [Vagococcus allomyrinae]